MIEIYLLEGKKNARTRQTLCTLTGLTDRQVRQEIEDLRNQGVFVVNDEDGDGYYITDDLAVLKRQYMKDTARAMSILHRRRHIRKYLKERGVEVK